MSIRFRLLCLYYLSFLHYLINLFKCNIIVVIIICLKVC